MSIKFNDYKPPVCLGCGGSNKFPMKKISTERLLSKTGTWIYRIDYQCQNCKIIHTDKCLRFEDLK